MFTHIGSLCVDSSDAGRMMCEQCALLVDPVTVTMCCNSRDVYTGCAVYVSDVNTVGSDEERIKGLCSVSILCLS